MRAPIPCGPRDVRLKQLPDPEIIGPTDAIIRIAGTRVTGGSYLLAGRRDLDLPLVLEKIVERFRRSDPDARGQWPDQRRAARRRVIDELSVLAAPVADARMGTAALFDIAGDGFWPRRLSLISVDRRPDDGWSLRYQVADAA